MMNNNNNNGFDSADFGADFNGDFSGFSADGSDKKNHVETPEETAARLSRKQLEQMADNLQPRQQAILQALQHARYMSSGQVAEFGFGDAASQSAAQRAANRTLNHLQDNGLVSSLGRRVGGVRAGSSGYVWNLTNAGFRLLNLDPNLDNPNQSQAKQPRKRSFEPSPRFLSHTLGVSELYIQLLGMGGIELVEVQFEPQCWREFAGGYSVGGTGGTKQQLKPDLYAVTSDGDYEDSWFFELDLNTEAPSRIVSKCELYEAYYATNAEQRQSGVFPLVVWIVPDGKRRDTVKQHIAQASTLRHKELFVVVLPDELEALVRKGAGL
jgi:hypothetical protein